MSHTDRIVKPAEEPALSQDEVDRLLKFSGMLTEGNDHVSLVDEIKTAILDSGKLSLTEWMAMRNRLKEIEQLIPIIDVIIRIKQEMRPRR